MEIYFYLLTLLNFAVGREGLNVHGPPGPAMVQFKDTVLLQCFAQAPVSLEGLQMEWRKIFSILLKNVVKDDAGIYRCTVKTPQELNETVVTIPSIGEAVILNCFVAHEMEEAKRKKKAGDGPVLRFQKKKISDASQSTDQEKAEISEIPKGNFTLKLKGLNAEDGEFICEVYTRHMSSARSFVALLSGDFSILYTSVLVLCPAALLITLVTCFSISDLLRKKVTSRIGLIIQASLILCPNLCTCVAYILSPKEVSFENIATAWIIFEHIKTAIAVGNVMYFNSAVISAGYAYQMHSTLVLETYNLLLFAFCVHIIKEYFGLSLWIVSVLPSLLMALLMVFSLRRYCFQGNSFISLHVALSFMVFMFSLLWISLYAATTIARRDFDRVWIFSSEAVVFILVWLAAMFQLHFHRKEFCSEEKEKGYWCCTVIVLFFIIALGTLFFHYTVKIMENGKDSTGFLALTILVHILIATFLAKSNLFDLLHLIIYLFGALGLIVMNSITLASEVILKPGTGVWTTENLHVIVLLLETVFVSGWLALLIYDPWMEDTNRRKPNFEDGSESEAELLSEIELVPAI